LFNTKSIASFSAVALLGVLTVGAAVAQQASAPYNPPGFERGQGGSNANLHRVRRGLEREIDMMQHDQHDYEGHRLRAISDLQAARNEIVAAEQYAKSHGY